MGMRALNRAEDLRGMVAQPELATAEREAKHARRVKVARPKVARSTVVRFVVFGVASILIYALFFGSVDQLFPVLTAGNMIGAGVVVALALCFSLIYGTFANYLLEVLGLRELK